MTSKLVKSKLESDEQEIMPTQKGTADRHMALLELLLNFSSLCLTYKDSFLLFDHACFNNPLNFHKHFI